MTNEQTPVLSNTEPIELPSKGQFYPKGSPMSSGEVELNYMTTYHEDILTSKTLLSKGMDVVVERLLDSLIATPGINQKDLLLGDRDALLIAARIMGYGSKYAVIVECPACGKQTEQDIDLSVVNDKEIDLSQFPEGSNQFSFILPYCKKEVVFKLLTQRDVDNIEREIKSLSKISNGVQPRVSTRLKYMIVSIDGDDDKNTIRRFVDKEMTSRDSLKLRDYYGSINPSLDLKYDFVCDKCGHTKEGEEVPIGASFFWPTTS